VKREVNANYIVPLFTPFLFLYSLSFDCMKIVSLNVGQPQEKQWMGKTVRTSIFKSPVTGKRRVSFLNVEGDAQADLKVHGGVNKAVYAYDLSHYAHWKNCLQRQTWEHGLFGENITTDGLLDDEARIGDVYQVGTAKLQVVQPRFPCTKLNVRFGLPDMMERFREQKRNGIYFRVVEEGEISAGADIVLIEPSRYAVTVQAYVDNYYSKGSNRPLLHTILSIPFLPEGQRKAFETFL
jgi:MOSC domain-containing protein YiiM